MSKSTGNQKGGKSGGNPNQGNKSVGGFGTQTTKTRNGDRGNSNVVPDKKSLGTTNNTKKS